MNENGDACVEASSYDEITATHLTKRRFKILLTTKFNTELSYKLISKQHREDKFGN